VGSTVAFDLRYVDDVRYPDDDKPDGESADQQAERVTCRHRPEHLIRIMPAEEFEMYT